MSLGAQNPDSVTTTVTSTPAEKSLATSINRWFERHWLLGFNTGWGIFTILPWLAPVAMFLGITWLGKTIYFIYNFFCHQLPERSWFLFGPQFSYTQAQIATAWGTSVPEINNELIRRQFQGTAELGWKVAWSDRMVAMYGSIFLFGLIFAILRQSGVRIKGLHWGWLLLLIFPLAIDGSTHLITDILRSPFRQSNEWAVYLTGGFFPPEFYIDDMFGSLNSVLRIISGIFFGFGIVFFLWPIMEIEFSPRARNG